MLAARLHEYGTGLRLDEVEEPRPYRPHDVIVRVGGAGVCRTDLHIIEGMLQGYFEVTLPFTLGHENAGWVEEVGDAVVSVRVGDPVIVHPESTCGVCSACHRGQDMYCSDSGSPGFNADGGFAQFLRTTERALVVLPDGLEPAVAAPYADAGLAAFHAVKKAAPRLGAGQSVVVVGVGGLGHIAVQALRALTPAKILAVDTSADALGLAEALGVDAAISGGSEAVAAVLDMTGGAGADAVMDFVGEGDVPKQAIAMLGKGGTSYVIGYGGSLEIPTAEFVGREISIVGNLVGTHAELEELTMLAAAGALQLETTPYPLEGIGDAMETLRQGGIRGRAVVVPN